MSALTLLTAACCNVAETASRDFCMQLLGMLQIACTYVLKQQHACFAGCMLDKLKCINLLILTGEDSVNGVYTSRQRNACMMTIAFLISLRSTA